MSCALLYTPLHLWSVLGPHSIGRTREQENKEGFLFIFPFFFLLSILEKLKMICQRQWYKATWWMGLSYSASQSFTPSFAAILSASFLWGKPLFPSPSTFQPNSLYLSMLGQRGEKAILSELNFISLPAHTVSYDSFVVWNYNVTFFFFFFLNGLHTI